MYSLTRIEAELDQMLEEEADPTARAEIELGLQVVTESLRRLSLVQGGADALISK
ncbi:LysR family transcriptional regulator [Roseibium sp. TrichSKD4]|nr:LysR family transcriptional regulator [Roseibium sp. TrichSKD4]